MWLLLVACSGGEKESADSAATESAATDDPCDVVEGQTGTLAISLQMEEDYIEVMDEPPVGTFRGSVFHCADASAIGPVDGAVAILDLTVEGVDLSGASGGAIGGPTGVMLVTEALPAEKVWVLGCLDSDGNDCEYNDPITLPNENRVTVIPGAETAFTVNFGGLNPS